MPRYVALEKREGETPLAALERFRSARPELRGVSITYAGRLDPMASGGLLLLIGDECKRRGQYDALDKEYVFEILFGLSSDTGDILGLADACADPRRVGAGELRDVLARLPKEVELPYPAFSSKVVDGKPLFVRARENTLPEIEYPTTKSRLYSVTLMDVRECSSADLAGDIARRLAELHIDAQSENPYKDFRRDEIASRWQEVLRAGGTYTLARLRATVSSGTYIRTLSALIAEELAACGLAYTIRRTRIGRYARLPFLRGVWTRRYWPL